MELRQKFETENLPAFVAVYCGVLFSTATKLQHFFDGQKKDFMIFRKPLICVSYLGGSCAIRTRDHRIKSATIKL